MNGLFVLGTSELYCLDERFSILAELHLGETPEEIALTLNQIRHSIKNQELAEFIQKLNEKGVELLYVEDRTLANDIANIYGMKALPYEDVALWRRLRRDFSSVRLTPQNRQELHDMALELSRRAIREVSQKGDQLVIQAMSSLDDVEKVQNLIASRLREWYGLHFPEASHKIESAQSLARLVVEGGHREEINRNANLREILLDSKVDPELLHKSMGADLLDQDMAMIQGLARQYLELQVFRENLEKYLDDVMQEIAPNMKGLIGSMIGARLIALAGGLDKLARLPASTIQVLGAEQALFRALKTGAKPPKHGIIFQYTPIHSAPWWQRGKIARILSGKIAIAARIDLYSGEYVADQLKQNVQLRISEVKRKYPTAPKSASKQSPKIPHRKPGKKYEKTHSPSKPKKRRRQR